MAKSKKEFDKELLYKKLMPSNFKATKNSSDSVEDESAFPAGHDLPASSRIPYRDISLPLMDNQPTVLVNLMENMVLEQLDSVMTRFHSCKCDRCKKDIAALALNKLPPKYVVLKKDQIPPDPDRQTSTQVMTAMIQAALQVRSNPRH